MPFPEYQKLTPPPETQQKDDVLQRLSDGLYVRWLTYRGKTMHLKAWCDHLGLRRDTVVKRLNALGWSVERALSEPTAARTPWRKYRNTVEKHVLSPEPKTEKEQRDLERYFLRNNRSVTEEHKLFQKEFGETKKIAYLRLVKEGRYLKFQRRKAEIRAQCKKARIVPFPSKTAIFYMALKDFPPMDASGENE